MSDLTLWESETLVERVRRLREFTPARVGLRTAGRTLATSEVLAFQVDHALARDAVWAEFDVAAMQGELEGLGLEALVLSSAAADRTAYLRRPDFGRRLDSASAEQVKRAAADVVFCVADGLSPLAIMQNAVPLLRLLIPEAVRRGRTVGPICLLRQGRVAAGDEIGERMGAAMCVLLIGERPGLSAADSMGAYLTWEPRVGRTDAERVCVSNIRPGGITIEAAAMKIKKAMEQARQTQSSGVRPPAPLTLR